MGFQVFSAGVRTRRRRDLVARYLDERTAGSTATRSTARGTRTRRWNGSGMHATSRNAPCASRRRETLHPPDLRALRRKSRGTSRGLTGRTTTSANPVCTKRSRSTSSTTASPTRARPSGFRRHPIEARTERSKTGVPASECRSLQVAARHRQDDEGSAGLVRTSLGTGNSPRGRLVPSGAPFGRASRTLAHSLRQARPRGRACPVRCPCADLSDTATTTHPMGARSALRLIFKAHQRIRHSGARFCRTPAPLPPHSSDDQTD